MNDTAPNLAAVQDAPGLARGKLWAAYMSLAMIGAVLWPVHENWRAKPRDNFPLTYYPMFSTKREAIETFYYLVGRDEQGTRYLVPYKLIGPGGLNSVRRQVRRIVREGRGEELAQSVARRLSRKDEPPWSKIVAVSVVKGKYSVDDFYYGRKEPVEEEIKGFSPVERRRS